jgi:hypothetical protein
VDGVVLDMSGDDIEDRKPSDSWKHCYLPIEHAVEVRVGDIVEVTYRRAPGPEGRAVPPAAVLDWLPEAGGQGPGVVSKRHGAGLPILSLV